MSKVRNVLDISGMYQCFKLSNITYFSQWHKNIIYEDNTREDHAQIDIHSQCRLLLYYIFKSKLLCFSAILSLYFHFALFACNIQINRCLCMCMYYNEFPLDCCMYCQYVTINLFPSRYIFICVQSLRNSCIWHVRSVVFRNKKHNIVVHNILHYFVKYFILKLYCWRRAVARRWVNEATALRGTLRGAAFYYLRY